MGEGGNEEARVEREGQPDGDRKRKRRTTGGRRRVSRYSIGQKSIQGRPGGQGDPRSMGTARGLKEEKRRGGGEG